MTWLLLVVLEQVNLISSKDPRFVAIASVTAKTDEEIPPVSTTGIITTISLNTSGTTEEIVVDDTLGIGTEIVKVLFVDKTLNRYRVKRETGWDITHPAGTVAAVDQRKLTYSVGVQTNLTTRQPRKIVFNPQNSVGFGTTAVVKSVVGVGTTTVVRVIVHRWNCSCRSPVASCRFYSRQCDYI